GGQRPPARPGLHPPAVAAPAGAFRFRGLLSPAPPDRGATMATVSEILDRKGTNVVAVAPDTTVLDAARLMNERGIGAVLVMNQGALLGIFTERDIMRRVVAAEGKPGLIPVREVMSTGLTTTTPASTVEECAALMTARR